MLSDEARNQLREDGFCIVRDALSPDELERVRAGHDRAVECTRERLGSNHMDTLDPNAANIRTFDLPSADPVFIELLRRPDALAAVEDVLAPHGVLVSNFTGNNALPGSGSMNLHSDQALVVPSPWLTPWAANVIWCLDDVYDANGATRYLPGSHRFQSHEDVPAGAMEQTVAFEAPAGSFIVMEGRMWHTSGRNVTKDQQRRMLFAYYSADFVRPQANWALSLPAELQSGLDTQMRELFGLGPMANRRIGGELTRLRPAKAGD